jgi:hypothetical protein
MVTVTTKKGKKVVKEATASSYTSVFPYHFEKARLTNADGEILSRAVTVTFKKQFVNLPVGSDNLKVYRMREVAGTGSGKWKMYDVQYYFTSSDWLTVSGFSLQIEAAENLTGVILEYLFIE